MMGNEERVTSGCLLFDLLKFAESCWGDDLQINSFSRLKEFCDADNSQLQNRQTNSKYLSLSV